MSSIRIIPINKYHKAAYSQQQSKYCTYGSTYATTPAHIIDCLSVEQKEGQRYQSYSYFADVFLHFLVFLSSL